MNYVKNLYKLNCRQNPFLYDWKDDIMTNFAHNIGQLNLPSCLFFQSLNGMYRVLFLFFFLFGWLQTSDAQINLAFESKNVGVGEQFEVRCNVTNFSNVLGADLVVRWDPNVLRPRSLSQGTTIVFSENDATFNTAEGVMLVRWVNGAGAISLPDGESFFTIEFEAIGGNGTRSSVTIDERYPDIRFQIVQEINGDIQPAQTTVGPGEITVGEAPDNVARLEIGSASGSNNDLITLPVTVFDFRNVIGMQFSMNWDAAFLEFVEVVDPNLEGLNVNGNFGTDNAGTGQLTFSWTTPSANEITVNNGTRIFQVRFRIRGSGGSSMVRFSDSPLARRITGVVDGSQGDIGFDGRSGTVTVAGGGGGGGSDDCDFDGLVFYFDDRMEQQNGTVCVPLRVRDFQEIDGMDMAITWDAGVLAYDRINNVSQIGNLNVFLALNDRLNLSFVDLGSSVDDNAILLEVCFDVVGSTGQSSPVEIFAPDNGGVYRSNTTLDFNQCQGTVTVGMAFDIDISPRPPSCQENTDGRIDVTLADAGAFTYEWTLNGAVVARSEDLVNVAAGDYTLVIRDGSGTTVFSRTISLQPPSPIRITNADITPSTDGTDGAIVINVTGGTGTRTFLWSNGATTQNLTGIGGGTYTVVITDANGCRLTSQEYVVDGEQGGLRISVTTSDYSGFNLRCHGASDGSINVVALGGAPPYTIEWIEGASGGAQMLENLSAGTYRVRIRDANNSTAERTIMLTQPPPITLDPDVNPDLGGNTGAIDLRPSGGVRPLRFSWNTPNNDNLAFVRNLAAGTYTVTVRDANDCQLTRRILVPDNDMSCFATNLVMTPNGDGRNDILQFLCLSQYRSAVLKVFDQWGALVYDSPSYANDWSGTSQSGEVLHDGAYYYVIKVEDDNGSQEVFKGSVTLINRLR